VEASSRRVSPHGEWRRSCHSPRRKSLLPHPRPANRRPFFTFEIAAELRSHFGALSYSRDFEREADDFARDYLLANHESPQTSIGFFEAIEGLRTSASK